MTPRFLLFSVVIFPLALDRHVQFLDGTLVSAAFVVVHSQPRPRQGVQKQQPWPLLNAKKKSQGQQAPDENGQEEGKGWFRLPFSRSSDSDDGQDEQDDEQDGGFLRAVRERFRGSDEKERGEQDTKKKQKKRSKRIKGAKEEEPPPFNPLPLLFTASKAGPLGAINTPSSQQAQRQRDKEEDEKRIQKQKQLEIQEQQKQKKLELQLQKEQQERQRREDERLRKQTAKNATGNNQDDDDSMFSKVVRFFTNNDNTNSTLTPTRSKTFRISTTSASNTVSIAQKFLTNLIAEKLNPPEKEQWIVVCPKARLQPGEIVPVEAAGLDLIIVASKDAQRLYAMENSCPHLGTPLETGMLERRPVPVQLTIAGKPVQPPNNPNPFALDNFDKGSNIQEAQVAAMLADDGCEDCIVCPLHRTAFALGSGQVRGEWCPYPPILGKVMAAVKTKTSAAVFDVRTRGKNIEVRINTPLRIITDDKDDPPQQSDSPPTGSPER